MISTESCWTWWIRNLLENPREKSEDVLSRGGKVEVVRDDDDHKNGQREEDEMRSSFSFFLGETKNNCRKSLSSLSVPNPGNVGGN